MSIDVSKLQVDSRDYVSIYDDLIAAIPDVSQIWNSTDENDPGIVLVKLMSMYGDMLSYNHDRAVLEVYPESVSQRKNAAQIFRLIGYKMRWYRSSRCVAYLTNTSEYPATLPEYTRFSTKDGDIYYTYIGSDAIKNPVISSNMSNSGGNLEVTLIQGYPRTPAFIGSNVIPYNSSAEWHSVYDYNVSKNDIQLDNRIYVADQNIEETSITLIDDSGSVWTQVDNIDALTESGKYYELRIDEYDRPYIELVPYWVNLNVSKFKLFYVVSLGQLGQITDNAIYRADSKVIAITGSTQNPSQTDISQYISITNEASTYGYNPETPDEARQEAAKYVNTYDTLVTLSDFEKATKRLEGVANCVATDKTNDPNYVDEYLDSGDGSTLSYSITLSRNNVTIYESESNRFEVYLYEKVGSSYTETLFCYAADNSGTLTPASGVVTIESASITNLDSGTSELSIDLNTALSSNKYLVARYHTTLKSTDIRIYITKSLDYDSSIPDEVFANSIISNLKDKKLMPLNIQIDLQNIKYYSWTVGGTIYLKEKVSLDKAQDILVNINNALKFNYSTERMAYNTIIGYSDIINTIMNTDNLIRNIDIDPIIYTYNTYNSVGDIINSRTANRDEVTGKYRSTASVQYNSETGEFSYTIENTPVKPGTVSVRVADGRCVISDDRNGSFLSNSSMFSSGTIDYNTGKVDIVLTSIDDSYIVGGNIDIAVNYTNNSINMAEFSGINTNVLTISDDCIKDLYY